MAQSSGTTDSVRLFLDDLDQYPLPGPDEQVDLAKRVAAGDDEARRAMIAANLRLVVHWARRYQDRGVDFGDLVQEGTFGLWYRFYKWPKGTLQLGLQYSYAVRHTWLGIGDPLSNLGGSPKAIDNMWFTSFRYYLPQ